MIQVWQMVISFALVWDQLFSTGALPCAPSLDIAGSSSLASRASKGIAAAQIKTTMTVISTRSSLPGGEGLFLGSAAARGALVAQWAVRLLDCDGRQ